MKIIKPGDLERLKIIKRFECKDCGCIFEADQHEFRSADAMEALHDAIDASCECPCCHNMVYRHRYDKGQ